MPSGTIILHCIFALFIAPDCTVLFSYHKMTETSASCHILDEDMVSCALYLRTFTRCRCSCVIGTTCRDHARIARWTRKNEDQIVQCARTSKIQLYKIKGGTTILFCTINRAPWPQSNYAKLDGGYFVRNTVTKERKILLGTTRGYEDTTISFCTLKRAR